MACKLKSIHLFVYYIPLSDISRDSISLFEYAGVIWSAEDVEEIEEDLMDVLAEEFQQEQQSVVFLRLRGRGI